MGPTVRNQRCYAVMANLKRKASTQAGADKNSKKAKNGILNDKRDFHALKVQDLTCTSTDSHKHQNASKQDRKSQNRHSDMITEAKKIWETLRRGDISREETKQLMDQIMGVIKGHVQEVGNRNPSILLSATLLTRNNRLFSSTMPLVLFKLV